MNLKNAALSPLDLPPEQGSEDREGSGCAARAADQRLKPPPMPGLRTAPASSVRGGCHPAEHRRKSCRSRSPSAWSTRSAAITA